MAATTLFVEPNDVLVFRDGRPFDAGADHLATGPFPPPPSTLYGAVRSALLAHAGARFDEPAFGLTGDEAAVLGTHTAPGSLSIGPPVLALKSRTGLHRLYPVPLDLLARKDGAGPEAVLLRPAPETGAFGKSNLPRGLRPLLPATPHPAGTFYERMGGLLTEEGFAALLAGIVPDSSQVVRVDEVFVREPRTSVSLRGDALHDFTGTGLNGKLFTVDFVRLCEGYGLAVDVQAGPIAVPRSGLLRLGGEGRTAGFTQCEPLPADRPAFEAGTKQVRVVLLSPAPFDAGWLPDGLDAGMLGGIRVRLDGAAVGRPVNVGGWDIAAGRPRPTRPAAPTGSVYFLTLEQPSDAAALFDSLDGQSLCSGADAQQGLGYVRLGLW
ncbi:MAG TPA: type III-B CRISPR module-associated protein Cmr3 [Rhodothermales bacterium]|nr:type III-B CRISPR module-associated protein Cmr3 [Rhodothermales bacterium]